MSYHGDSKYHLYSTTDNSLISALDIHPDSEPQWHPSDPKKVRYISGPNSYNGSLKLFELDVDNNDIRTIADLTSRVQAKLPGALYLKDEAEGSPSMDGNRYAWIVYNKSEDPIGMIAYDVAADQLLGFTDRLDKNTNWVSMSPKGNYVISSSPSGTFRYNPDFSNKSLVTEAIEHSDIGLAADGSQTYVYIDFNSSSPTAGWLTAVSLDTLERTKIFDIYDNANSSVHVSMKGYNKPGWALVSTYSCKVPGAWTCEKVMAVEIAPNGRILNLAHTYNCGENYWTETHAVVNQDFTRVYFNSDGGSCGTDAEIYKLDVPKF